MPPATTFQSKILTREAEPGDYAIYRAGLEWDLSDPIVIEKPEDFKSTPRWKERLTPFDHQVSNCGRPRSPRCHVADAHARVTEALISQA
jgi:hypothetical protein